MWILISLLIGPGVLACLISMQFDNYEISKNKLKIVASYFIYSFVIIVSAMQLSTLIGLINSNSMRESSYLTLLHQCTVEQSTEIVLITILLSIVVGGSVPFLLRRIR